MKVSTPFAMLGNSTITLPVALTKRSQGVTVKEPRTGVISDDLKLILLIITHTSLCFSFCLLGIVTNVLNIIIFRRMGFQETINVSLFSMAISDLGSLIFLMWETIVESPMVISLELPFDPLDIGHLTAGWPHIPFVRATGWITAFVSVERYLCIARPLAVKKIITVTRVKVIVTIIFVVNLSAVIPVYLTNLFVWKSVDNGTRIILGMTYSDDREDIEHKANMFNQVASPFTSFAIVFIFAIAISVKLKRQSAWRQKISTASQDAKSETSGASKETKIGKMMVTISTIFILCFTPSIVIFVMMFTIPELKWEGVYGNSYLVLFWFSHMLESLNSSVNIFIYYSMSSKFKKVFKELVPWTAAE